MPAAAAHDSPLRTAHGEDHEGSISTASAQPIETPFALLSSCNGVLGVERLAGDSFVIRTDRAGWLSNVFARILRTRPLAAGRVYDTDLFQATLLELTPDGSDALAVRFDLKRPLEDPSLLLLYWNGHRFEPLDMESLAPGAALELADTSDVWAGML